MRSSTFNALRVSKAARRLARRQAKENKSRIDSALVRARCPEVEPGPVLEETWSFQELCVPLYHEMVAFARRLTGGDIARAEDLVQDSMLKAFNAWSRWRPYNGDDPARSARAWLFQTVSNTFVKDYHHRGVQSKAMRARPEDVMEWTIAQPEALIDSVDSPYGDEVAEAIHGLSRDHRVVLDLFYRAEMSCDQIAEELGIPKNTVHTKLKRARAALAPAVKDYAATTYGLRDRAGEDAVKSPHGPEGKADAVNRVMIRRAGKLLNGSETVGDQSSSR